MWWPTSNRNRRRWAWAAAPLLAGSLWALFWTLANVVFPLPREFLETDYSTLHLDRDGGLARLDLSPGEKYRLRLRLSDMSPFLVRGFLLYEDRHFYRHPGVNPVALGRAALSNLRRGRVLMGGSTISMQVAKLMEPKRRTLGGKCVEIFRAFQLERAFGKDELLEVYLNSVPLGGNIEGVGAAAYLYFGKPPAALSPAESALLVGLPKSPALFRPDRRPEAARAQREKVLARVGERLGLSAADRAAALTAPLPTKRFPNPRRLPHLVERARRETTAGVRRYTVDPQLQAFCEDRLARAARRLRRHGVHNGAVIVVENATRRVLAYVGSPDFEDAGHGGQVNGAAIPRSPGSLLKPFLYARAVEEGLITPRRLVHDVERQYDGYEPANFERRAWGPIPAEEALALSLNTPAVDMEWRLGARGLAGFLEETRLFGARLRRADPGLSVVLGAFPVSLEEAVSLYAALADGGRLRPLQFFAGATDPVGRPVLSPEAAHITASMLSTLLRPDLPQSWEFTANRGRFAYKTGTSFRTARRLERGFHTGGDRGRVVRKRRRAGLEPIGRVQGRGAPFDRNPERVDAPPRRVVRATRRRRRAESLRRKRRAVGAGVREFPRGRLHSGPERPVPLRAPPGGDGGETHGPRSVPGMHDGTAFGLRRAGRALLAAGSGGVLARAGPVGDGAAAAQPALFRRGRRGGAENPKPARGRRLPRDGGALVRAAKDFPEGGVPPGRAGVLVPRRLFVGPRPAR
ncbi:MAG: transglycosylase domain-containing protein [Elusimicrobia bacterium]|nr:transglycosylase domain-containing protein [Elusimicrobiota bacterium]